MTSAEARRGARLAPSLRAVLGYLIAAACLVWIFHDVRLPDLWREMAAIRWGWVGPAILLDVLSYAAQGVRWELLLRPTCSLSPARATQAIYAGLFTNEILPMRFGEVVRAYLVSRWTSIGLAAVVPSMAIERLFDGIWLALAIGIVAIFVHLPRNLARAADVLGIIVVVATALFAWLVLWGRRGGGPAGAGEEAPAAGGKLLRGIRCRLGRLAARLGAMGRTRTFYLSFGASLFILVFQALAFWLVMRACGLTFSVWVGAAVLLIVHFGTALPNAPGNIGSYQFFVIVGLALFGVDKTRATGFSLVVFVLLTVPLWAIGSLALGRSGASLKAIRREAGQWAARIG